MPSRLFAFGVTFGIAALMTYVLVTGRDLLIPFAIAVMIWYVIIALSRLIEVQLSALAGYLCPHRLFFCCSAWANRRINQWKYYRCA